jgi:hypothetical protein
VAFANFRITFESESGETTVFEKRLEFTDIREPGGKEFIAQYLLSISAMESRWNAYLLALPNVNNFMRETTQKFKPEDFFSGGYVDRFNTREMWIEICHVLLRLRVLLATSRAYHDQELEPSLNGNLEEESVRWHLHLDKIERFELAVIMLGKVNELAARLVFERLGASLIPNLDKTKPNWERDLTWTNIKKGLAHKTGNSYLAAIPDDEYKKMQAIFDDFLMTENGTRIRAYRNKVVHRRTPSVDRPDLYTHLESRDWKPIADEAGSPKGWTRTISLGHGAAEYVFTELYGDAVEMLRHYVECLERLNAIPRFSPEAKASSDNLT